MHDRNEAKAGQKHGTILGFLHDQNAGICNTGVMYKAECFEYRQRSEVVMLWR